MEKVIPIEVSKDAWPKIAEAGCVTLTDAEILQFQYSIFMYTHGYNRALIDAKLTDDEAEKLKRARQLTANLEAALRDFDFGLKHRLEKADEKRRQSSRRSQLSDLTDAHLCLIEPRGLAENLKLLNVAIDTVLATPVREKAERNLGTRPFMRAIKEVYVAAEIREAPRRSKWPKFFHEFYSALPQPTQKLLVSEAAALKQLEVRRRGHGKA